jgi:ribonuclease P protein component
VPQEGGAKGYGFPKSSRLLKPSEFRNTYQNGTRVPGRLFAAFCLRREGAEGAGPRVGFTAPRAFGKAVQRNRAKRRIREALRVRLASVNGPWDIVVNPRRAALTATVEELRREVERLVNQCGKR